MDPYDILGIALGANDEGVRKAYLDLVRSHSPDLDPEAFKRISAAYQMLKDEKSRLRYYLFDKETPGDSPFHAFLGQVTTSEKRKPLSYDHLKEFLRKCAKR
jgi:curved DNA-binding protein CbpA